MMDKRINDSIEILSLLSRSEMTLACLYHGGSE